MTEDARERLEIMVATTNGFEIAEKDLQLRGPGEFFGTRQQRRSAFHVANPLRDRQLLEQARGEAFALVEDSTRAGELNSLVKYLGPGWQKRYLLAAVG